MFFGSWQEIWRTVVVGVLAYAALVVMLRVAGKRTLSKLNAFDLVVTVAMGSTLATILLSKQTTLAQGVTALALLVGLQYAVTWTSVRWGVAARAVRSEPRLLAYRGSLLPEAMRQERVVEDEVLAAIRAAGKGGVGEVEAVVMETDGTLSAVEKGSGGEREALERLSGAGGEVRG